MIVTREEAEARLEEILARGSANLGARAGVERLLLLVTRACRMHCSYCLVDTAPDAGAMPLETARRAVDLLMLSERPRLELQLFGGEPTEEWERALQILEYAKSHPGRRERKLELIVTSNGVLLDEARISTLARVPVVLMLSADGAPEVQRRFRGTHAPEESSELYARVERALEKLVATPMSWFVNVVVPPAAACEVEERYAWAVERGVPRLQLNYAVGMRWHEAQMAAYLEGLERVLLANHANPQTLLHNWQSNAEPVMLSDDLIVDVDGSVFHDGAIFLERGFGRLRETHRRGHVTSLREFDSLRWDLATLYDKMRESYPPESPEREVLLGNMRLGASVDVLIERLRRELGHSPAGRA